MQKDTIRNKTQSRHLLSKTASSRSKIDYPDQHLLRNKRGRMPTLNRSRPETNSFQKQKRNIKADKGANSEASQKENCRRCDICLEYIHFSNDKITTCTICNCTIHRSCLSKQLSEEIDLDVEEYTCNRCYEAVVDDCSIEKFK